MVHLTFNAREFSKALAVLGTLVKRKTALPILNDVHLCYDQQRKAFTLTASDSESWLTLDAPFLRLYDPETQESRTLSVCLPFAVLREALAQLPDLLVNAFIDTQKQMLRVDYQTGEFTIPTELAAEFPAAPAVAEKDGGEGAAAAGTPLCRLTLPADWLLAQMKLARTCVAADELRPVMNTELLEVTHEGINICSSDGHSLYLNSRHEGVGSGFLDYGDFPADGQAQVLVPSGVLDTVTTAFQQSERVTIAADSQRVLFTADGIRLTARLQEGRYPNYRSVIPQNNPHSITAASDTLRAALRRISIFANEGTNMVEFKREGDVLLLQATDIDFSRAGQERVAIEPGSTLPDGQKFGFKISTLQALLQCVQTETVRIELSDPARVGLLKEEDTASSLVLLIMPMLVNE